MILLAMTLVVSQSFVCADESTDDILFSTSFEDGKVGSFQSLQDGTVQVRATGTAAITPKYAHTGKQCLHLLGDENNTITFILPEDLRSVKGISFHAERWTRRAPFSFRVEVQQDDTWREVAQLDYIVITGARFRSHVQLPITGDGETQAIRFQVTAASKSGVLIDDLSFHETAPKRPTPIPTSVMPSEPLELVDSQPLFTSGTQGTHTFRIPAIVTATNGDLLAVCDARRKSSGDLGYQRTIDIVCRRSIDNGKTWTPMEVIENIQDGGCSDASLIVDQVTGDIFCFYNYITADRSKKEYRFMVQKSSDHGKTWGEPVDFTDQVAGPELKNAFKFITSGRGIQTREGLLMHDYVHIGKGVIVFGSRDHGKTWEKMGEVSPGDESKVVQLPSGSLMVNSRISPGKRFIHRSSDGGKTWESNADFSLPDPNCNACIIQYTAQRDGYAKDRLLFCNAASNNGRKNLAVRISYDGGLTWSAGKVIDNGPSAYSSMTILKDGSIGVLYEPGYKEVRFVRFTLSALTGEKLNKPYVPHPTAGP
tara:strand:- start:195867 stop:197480 length:1614 start_codon:yes stop_codon:yes gene_type:complete